MMWSHVSALVSASRPAGGDAHAVVEHVDPAELPLRRQPRSAGTPRRTCGRRGGRPRSHRLHAPTTRSPRALSPSTSTSMTRTFAGEQQGGRPPEAERGPSCLTRAHRGPRACLSVAPASGHRGTRARAVGCSCVVAGSGPESPRPGSDCSWQRTEYLQERSRSSPARAEEPDATPRGCSPSKAPASSSTTCGGSGRGRRSGDPRSGRGGGRRHRFGGRAARRGDLVRDGRRRIRTARHPREQRGDPPPASRPGDTARGLDAVIVVVLRGTFLCCPRRDPPPDGSALRADREHHVHRSPGRDPRLERVRRGQGWIVSAARRSSRRSSPSTA